MNTFTSELKNCHIRDSINVLEGMITCGTRNSYSFEAFNSSFIQNYRKDNLLEAKERVDTPNSASFSSCEWDGCSSTKGGGIFCHDNFQADLKVESSSFVSCKATSSRGGGIYALNIGKCLIYQTNFSLCTASGIFTDHGGGGVQIEEVTTQHIFENCIFSNNGASNDGGGASILNSYATIQSDCVLFCTFVNCRCNNTLNGNGGGLELWGAQTPAVVRSCLFHKCTSGTGGGGVTVEISTYNRVTVLFYCFFHLNTALTAGLDAVLFGGGDVNRIDPSCRSTSTSSNRVSKTYAVDYGLGSWLPCQGGRTRFVASPSYQSEAANRVQCGFDPQKPCASINFCISQMIPFIVNELVIDSSVFVQNEGIILDSTFSIEGKSKAGTLLQCEFSEEGTPLITVDECTFAVKHISIRQDISITSNCKSPLLDAKKNCDVEFNDMDISFKIDDPSDASGSSLQAPVFRIEHSDLSLTQVSVSHLRCFYSVISHTASGEAAKLTFSSCDFTSIARSESGAAIVDEKTEPLTLVVENCVVTNCGSDTSNDGGSINVVVGTVGSISVTGGQFVGCYSSEETGKGGAICLKLSEADEKFLINVGKFSDNIAKYGSSLFVRSPNLELTALSGKITGLESTSTVLTHQGYDNNDETVAIPLVSFIMPATEHFISSTSENFKGCGYEVYPCQTMSFVLSEQRQSVSIVLAADFALKEEVSIQSSSVSVRGVNNAGDMSNPEEEEEEATEQILRVTESGSEKEAIVTVEEGGSLAMNGFSFLIPLELQTHSSLFKHGGIALSLTSICFNFETSGGLLKYQIADVFAGRLDICDATLDSLQFSKAPFVISSSSEAIFVNGKFSSLTSTEEIVKVTETIASARSLTFSSRQFSLQTDNLTPEVESSSSSSFSSTTTTTTTLPFPFASNPTSRLSSASSSFLFNSTNFTSITRSSNGPACFSSDSFAGCSLAITNSVFTGCTCTQSAKGGALYFSLSPLLGKFTVNSSIISQSAASELSGKGGGIYLNCVEPSPESSFSTSSTTLPSSSSFSRQMFSAYSSLPFSLCYSYFFENIAFSGKDVFIYCSDISQQISSSQFLLDYTQDSFQPIDSVYGRDLLLEESSPDVDLTEQVKFVRHGQIYVKKGGAEDSMCGTFAMPCGSLDVGLEHISTDMVPILIVQEEIGFNDEIALSGITLKSKEGTGTISMNSNYAASSADASIISTSAGVQFDHINVKFQITFQSDHSSFLQNNDGTISLVWCIFDAAQASLSSTASNPSNQLCSGTTAIFSSNAQPFTFCLINLKAGELVVDNTKFNSLQLSHSLIVQSAQTDVHFSNSEVFSLTAQSFIESQSSSVALMNATISESLFEKEIINLADSDFITSKLNISKITNAVSVLSAIKTHLDVADVSLDDIHTKKDVFVIKPTSAMNVSIEKMKTNDVTVDDGSFILLEQSASTSSASIYSSSASNSAFLSRRLSQGEQSFIAISLSTFSGITLSNSIYPLFAATLIEQSFVATNCSFVSCSSSLVKGKHCLFTECSDILFDCCVFDGAIMHLNGARKGQTHNSIANNSRQIYFDDRILNSYQSIKGNKDSDESDPVNIKKSQLNHDLFFTSSNEDDETFDSICKWNSSLVDVQNCNALMKGTTFARSSVGALSVSGGRVAIENCEFTDNNPSLMNYESARRNLLCSNSGTITISSLKGQEHADSDSSLWILNDGCTLDIAIKKRPSYYFIPVLDQVVHQQSGSELHLTFQGLLFLPCNMSFQIVHNTNGNNSTKEYNFDSSTSFVNETRMTASVPSSVLETAADETEVSVSILYGDSTPKASTTYWNLKNRTVPDVDPTQGGDNGNNGLSNKNASWAVTAFVIVLVVLILTVVAVLVAFVCKRKKRVYVDETGHPYGPLPENDNSLYFSYMPGMIENQVPQKYKDIVRNGKIAYGDEKLLIISSTIDREL
ncbi:uncharacterized protein MONOS_12177 [Monocercomonoides exilis]|uniref:uncharacterized protein n=1 Tax=Monocercomonoides exilis TaxID=2049356 RepID=UPI00355AB0E6|nr:hypothetical protein MONOS_12177 [Monocercomonoides exilis]|eukprot:MONOS_12177.1-p1 / transcript=MONOS_12177.1 / gene=MONOS_12177 / organism=Monocercomonoides_exilis_PA203 / gene_product=unspecified product / transcript_product=unspecified product / location=Mono_scaffold00656:13003-18816(-) / protein_length=1938 / sequence_SO=supercontig / SO=protein_coding / is_pseudo=false